MRSDANALASRFPQSVNVNVTLFDLVDGEEEKEDADSEEDASNGGGEPGNCLNERRDGDDHEPREESEATGG